MSAMDDSQLERRREDVIEVLTTAFAEDHIGAEEFESLLERASKTMSRAELDQVLRDLPPSALPARRRPSEPAEGDRGGGEQPRRPALRGDWSVNYDAPAESTPVVSILSGTTRKGLWDPPKSLQVFAFLGGSEIDLTEARIPAGGMTIRCMALLGGVEITVPDGINVDVGGLGILGAFEGKRPRSRPIPDAPTIKVEGLAFLGGVEVKYR